MALAPRGQLYQHYRVHRIERAARLRAPELMVVIGGIAVFLGFAIDADLPFFAVSEE